MSLIKRIDKRILGDALFIVAWAVFLLGRLLSLTEWCALAETQAFPAILQGMDYLAAGLALLVIILNFIRRIYSCFFDFWCGVPTKREEGCFIICSCDCNGFAYSNHL